MSIKLRMILVLTATISIPEGYALYLLESGRVDMLKSFLSVHLALSLAFLGPISRFCSYLIVGREISAMFMFCHNIKMGHYDMAFSLANEEEDEPEIVKLKRLLNWMAHSLSVRENTRQQQLGKNEELKKHFQKLSMKDELTQLYNRRFFNSNMQLLVKESLNSGKSLSLMLIDVDNFKKVNDTLGHQKGDELLIMLADTMFTSIRSENDIPFRYGGDEFGIILPGISGAEGITIASRIKAGYGESAPEITSLSIGVATLCHDLKDVESGMKELIQRADECVYMAKSKGRDSIVIDGREMEGLQQFALENA
ncbi:GGDEF domain-containing protein [Desulfosediminicola flagellatus]|uniref:GGDEF domain-containing protein n=1 Tax=Desulfosediminicola flagellatus TaxID=2569541 RepID=UPI0010ACA0E1|nr:GGDEF domain-containing protein [Desulfosediminicola flagellatus]